MSRSETIAALIASFEESLAQVRASGAPQDPKARTRDRIVREATRLFQHQGYRKVSVDEIAREAGVAKGTIYLYFRNKAELLLAAIAEEKKPLVEPFWALLVEDLEPEERLRRFLELSFVSIPRAPLGAKLASGDRELFQFLDELPEDRRATVLKQQGVAFHLLLEGVGAFDRLDPEEKERRITAFRALMYSGVALIEERLRGGLSLQAYASQLAKILVAGLGAP